MSAIDTQPAALGLGLQGQKGVIEIAVAADAAHDCVQQDRPCAGIVATLCAELAANLLETEQLGAPARQSIDDVPPRRLAARVLEVCVDLAIERHDCGPTNILATRTRPPGRLGVLPQRVGDDCNQYLMFPTREASAAGAELRQ